MKDECDKIARGAKARTFILRPSEFIVSDRSPSHEETVSAVPVDRSCSRRKPDWALQGDGAERRDGKAAGPSRWDADYSDRSHDIERRLALS